MDSKRKQRWMRDFGLSDRGNAAVEFALCIPLLILIMVAVIEFGRGLHDFHVVNETVRDAARFLGRSPIDCSGAGAGCATCASGGSCGPCQFIDAGGNPDGNRIPDALAIAMTGNLSGGGADDLLGYWQHPADAGSTITVEVCRIDNSGGTYSGIYDGEPVVPHVRLSADVPFNFMFGELIAPTPTIEFSLAHNVVITGR